MKNKKWVLPLVLLAIVLFFVCWMCNTKRTDKNHLDTTSAVLPPIYLSQMQSCRDFGGQVEEKDKDMGTWTALDKWRCNCEEGKEFSTNLKCNQWYTPESGY